MWEISSVGTGASVEMVDAQEVSEGNELNTSGEYTKWPPVAGVTIDATKQLGRREPSPKLKKKSKPQAISSFQELGTQTKRSKWTNKWSSEFCSKIVKAMRQNSPSGE